MKMTAVRLYGKKELRLETFELPDIKEDEILAEVISDSLCMSSYKEVMQGAEHKRVPDNVYENPVIIGHEFCGIIRQVGEKWKDKYKAGENFCIQPAHNKNGALTAPGYSFPYCGGDATFVIIPPEIMEMNCLLKYESDVFFMGSLAEPMSCIIGAFHASYHTNQGTYIHEMGIKKGGKMALLAGAGPMGLGSMDYALHNPDKRPSMLVVTDIDDTRLKRAESIFSVKDAKECGVELKFINTRDIDAIAELRSLTGGTGFDDVFVFASVKQVVEQGDAILAKDGCMSFFAGPGKQDFRSEINFYNVHYNYTHIMGTNAGNNDDMSEAARLIAKGIINPAVMVTHIGGIDCVAETTLDLPNIPGGKKLVYTHISMPLTAIKDFEEKGKDNPLLKELSQIIDKKNNLWSKEAEKYLLANAYKI